MCAIIVGYFFHRKRKTSHDTLEVLRLPDIFIWIDDQMNNVKRDSASKYEVNILPNKDTQKLIKKKDTMAYAVILSCNTETKTTVVSTKIFYAKSIDVDLESLNQGNIVVIPIE